MTVTTILFLCLCTVLQGDLAAAHQVSADANGQCLLSLLINQSVQLQQQATELQQQKNQLQQQKNQLQQQDSQMQQQDSQMQQQDSQMQQITNQQSRLEREMASVKTEQAANTQTVAFSAYISDQPNIHASQGHAALFRGIITNIGGSYSTLTSAFTAPVPGQYFFSIDADCSKDFRGLKVTVNGKEQFSAQNDGVQMHVSTSGLVMLKKGDVVTTKCFNSNGFLDAGRESTFSGFLVK